VAAAIAVLVVVLLMVVVRGGGTKGKVSLSGTSSTTGSTLAFLPGTPGGSVAGDTTTVAAASSTSSTSSTTVKPTTTTAAGATTTTATTLVPATTIATVTDCPPSALTTQTATDQPSYSSGQLVTITVTVYNSSARTCLVQHPFPVGTKSPIGVISNGRPVWAQPPGSSGVIDSPKALNPNGSYLWATAAWNQKDNSGAQVPQGIYQAAANDPPGGGTPQVTFTIGP
jgi:hypothetical protein